MIWLWTILTCVITLNVAWLSRRHLPWLFRPKMGFGIIPTVGDPGRCRCKPPGSWLQRDGTIDRGIRYVVSERSRYPRGTMWRCECGKAWRVRSWCGLPQWVRARFSDTRSASEDVVKLAQRIVRDTDREVS